MSGRFKPLRVPVVLFVVGLLGVAVSLCVLRSSTAKIDSAIAKIDSAIVKNKQIRCGAVPWRAPRHCHGTVWLQLAESRDSAQDIVKAIRADSSGAAAVVMNLQLDYFLILSYVTCLTFLGASVACLAGLLKVPLLRTVLLVVVALQPIAGLLDGCENVGLLLMLNSGMVTESVYTWTHRASMWKWWLITIGLVLPVLALLFLFFRHDKVKQAH